MMTDRILSSDEAAKIKQWSDDGIAIMAEAGATEEAMRAPRLVRGLAATVVALHERIETLQRIADEKSHEAGLYARRMSQAQIAMREALAKARTEPDHDYVETTLDRDDNPTPPRCAYCGRGEAFCKGRKP